MNIEELNKKIVKLAKTRKGAIEGSVLKWEFLCKADREAVQGSHILRIKCGLCVKYYDIRLHPGCQKCLLYKIKQKCDDIGSAWKTTNIARRAFCNNPTLANFRKWRKAAREMLRVLKTL